MNRKKPPARRAIARTAENDPRDLMTPKPTQKACIDLAAKARFAPYSKHKKDPTIYKMTAYHGPDEDITYCDGDADFLLADMARAPNLLKRGILAGLWGDKSKKGDPSRLWTIDDNGWIYEAQITNPGYGGYHAYPVLRNEAIARKVLARYRDHVETVKCPVEEAALAKALERYQ